MFSKMDIPLEGPSVNIVRRCGPALSAILESKFGCVATFDGVDFEGDPSIARQRRPTLVPEKRFGVSLPAGVQVSVVKADLANFQVDAVVNAANEGLQHYGGLALALSSAGGPQIQQDSDNFIRRNGSLNTGDAVVMDARLLPCKKIIHAVGPSLPPQPYKSDVARAEPLLKKAITSILDRVQENRLQSVAIPAISSGLFHFPLPLCADAIVSTVKRYYERSSRHLPKEILLVNNDEPTVKEMERACHQILSPNSPMIYSQAVTGKTRGGAKMSPLTVQMGSVHLTLRKGKIEDQQTDVIVNTTYSRDLRNGQISDAILEKAGHKMQEEMYAAVPIAANVIITQSYKLPCKEVYHTFCIPTGMDTVQEVLFRSVLDCLWLAVKRGHMSIAFPAIGTGGLGFSKKEVAQIMSNAVSQFAKASQKKMEVHFVIFHSDDYTFKAFEEQMRSLKQMTSQSSPTHEVEPREEFRGSRAPHPQISLRGPSMEAIEEAQQWLRDLLFKFSGSVVICNNFILHLGEKEQLQLSHLMETGVSIEESFERGHASIIVGGESHEDVVVAGLQVEAMLCNIQKEFVREEESAILMMLVQKDISFKRTTVGSTHPVLSDRMSAFKHHGLQVVKVDKVENATLRMLFDMKKEQLNCFTTQTMFQRIPAQFCEMVSHIGFHAEYAPPDDAAYGEGIYFTSSVKKAMKVWKVANEEEYLHFVEAEVLIGDSTPGKPGLILPPAKRKDPQVLYDSVGGLEVSVIFSGYQALPMYIITCRAERFRKNM